MNTYNIPNHKPITLSDGEEATVSALVSQLIQSKTTVPRIINYYPSRIALAVQSRVAII